MPEATASSPESSAQGITAESGKSGAESTDVKGVVEALVKRLDSQSAAMRRMQEKLESLQVKPAAAEEKEVAEEKKGPIKTQLEEFAKYRKEQEAKNERMRKAAISGAIKNKLLEAGVPADAVKLHTDGIMSRIGSKVEFTETPYGTEEPVIKDGDGVLTVDEYFSAFMSSTEGKAILPSEPAPTLRGLPRSGTNKNVSVSKVKYTAEDMRMGRYDPTVVRTGNFEVIDLA